jgi:two-component system, sensor histidine kinase PdtaS
LAREYATNGQLDSMAKYVAMAKKIFSLVDKRPYYRASVCNELATIYLILKQPENAVPYALMARKVMDSLQRFDNVLQPMGLLMNAYFSLKKYGESERIANEMLELGKKREAKLYIRDAYKGLADLASVNNDYKAALEYYKKFKEWNDSIYSEAKAQSIASVELKSQLAAKELETKFESQKKADLNKALQQKNKALTVQNLIAFIAAIILLVLGVLLFSANSKKQKINKQLKAEKLVVEEQANEKLVLINEIHHRVKNNLTMLKSLFYLQAKSAGEPETKRVLREAQARIQSMALVHQNLYDGKSATKINLQTFIKDLFDELALAYMDVNKKIIINVAGWCNDVEMGKALPVALIMNELATNSFKYAFVSKEKGKIGVDISQDNEKVIIQYHDDGPGLEKDFALASGGFGFKVINILLQQLDASIEYKKTDGLTIFTIVLPL